MLAVEGRLCRLQVSAETGPTDTIEATRNLTLYLDVLTWIAQVLLLDREGKHMRRMPCLRQSRSCILICIGWSGIPNCQFSD